MELLRSLLLVVALLPLLFVTAGFALVLYEMFGKPPDETAVKKKEKELAIKNAERGNRENHS